MSGEIKFLKKEKNREHTRALINLTNGKITYISTRMLGKITISEKQKFIKNKKLGPDALKIKQKQFETQIKKNNSFIKTFLMNQRKISGIGNIYTDEILFQSKIHPKKQIKKLENKEIKKLYKKIKEVLKQAIKNNAKPEKMPKNYLIKKREKNKKCPKCKSKIKTIKINSRTAYYCPKCQNE